MMNILKRINWQLSVLMLYVAFVCLPLMPLLASTIINANFYGVITISNNGTDASNVQTTANISTQSLIDGGYIDADAENTVIRNTSGTDVAFMPGISGNPWAMNVASIGQNSYLSYLLYTGNVTGGEIRYFPGSGGMTASDNDASLELGGNFTIEQHGYVDTAAGSDKNLVYKQASFKTYIQAANSIRSAILEAGVSANVTLYPDDEGAYINIASQQPGSGEHWDKVDEAGADDDGTYVYTANAVEEKDAYTLQDASSIPNDYWSINSVTVYFRIKGNGGVTYGKPYLRLGADETTGTQKSAPVGSYSTFNEVLARPGGGNWTKADIDSLQVATGIWKSAPAAGARLTQTYIVVNYTPSAEATTVTATGVSSGELTVKTDTYGITLGALGFNGTSSVVQVNDDASIHPANNVTVEAWIYQVGDGTGNAQGLVNNMGGSNRGYGLSYYKPNDKLTWFVKTTGGGSLEVWSDSAITPGQWYHLVGAYDGTLRMYVDGVLQADTKVGAAPVIYEGQDLFMGKHSSQATYFNGYIDEVRIYSRTLGLPEIQSNYNSGVGLADPTDQTNLEAWWHFDTGTGTDLIDETANSNDGVITDGTWVDGHVPSKFTIYIDGAEQDSDKMATVTDNANDWAFLQNNVMPYMESHNITIGGNPRQSIEWEYDTTFTDSTGNGNDTTPTFRTASSDADVIGVLSSFQPIEEARAPVYTLEEAADFITTAPNITGNFSTTVTPTFPGADIFTDMAAAGQVPSQLPLFIVFGFGIIVLSLTFSWALRKSGSGSIVVKALVVGGVMAFAVGVKAFDLWMLLFFAIIAIALAMASKQQGWN